MAEITREGIVSIYDILAGCRTLTRREVPVGDTLDHFVPFAEHVLDQYFFNLELEERALAEIVGDAFELPADLATEISTFVEKSLLERIQNTFRVVYPSRQYNYTVNLEQGFIRIVESKPNSQRFPTIHEEIDESDAWIPERQRVRG